MVTVMVVLVVVVDRLRWLCSVVVVVDGDSGRVWRLWWRVAAVVVYSSEGGGGWRWWYTDGGSDSNCRR